MRCALPATLPATETRIAPVVAGRLALGAPDRDGRAFVSAASGIAAAGGVAWVVSDEYGELARFDRLDRPGALHAGLAKAKGRPDLESLLAVPGARGGATLLGFGSGSKDSHARDRVLVRDVTADGHLDGHAREASMAPLYDRLRRELPMGVNVEGAVLRGDELLLLHRGRLVGDQNAIIRVDARRALAALRSGGDVAADALLGVVQVELGTLDGERLGFADAHVLPDGRIVFAASAETAEAAEGGAVRGSAIGILDAAFAVQQLHVLDGPPRKVEGIVPSRELDPAADPSSFTLVTDPDDPTSAAELLRITLPAT